MDESVKLIARLDSSEDKAKYVISQAPLLGSVVTVSQDLITECSESPFASLLLINAIVKDSLPVQKKIRLLHKTRPLFKHLNEGECYNYSKVNKQVGELIIYVVDQIRSILLKPSNFNTSYSALVISYFTLLSEYADSSELVDFILFHIFESTLVATEVISRVLISILEKKSEDSVYISSVLSSLANYALFYSNADTFRELLKSLNNARIPTIRRLFNEHFFLLAINTFASPNYKVRLNCLFFLGLCFESVHLDKTVDILLDRYTKIKDVLLLALNDDYAKVREAAVELTLSWVFFYNEATPGTFCDELLSCIFFRNLLDSNSTQTKLVFLNTLIKLIDYNGNTKLFHDSSEHVNRLLLTPSLDIQLQGLILLYKASTLNTEMKINYNAVTSVFTRSAFIYLAVKDDIALRICKLSSSMIYNVIFVQQSTLESAAIELEDFITSQPLVVPLIMRFIEPRRADITLASTLVLNALTYLLPGNSKESERSLLLTARGLTLLNSAETIAYAYKKANEATCTRLTISDTLWSMLPFSSIATLATHGDENQRIVAERIIYFIIATFDAGSPKVYNTLYPLLRSGTALSTDVLSKLFCYFHAKKAIQQSSDIDIEGTYDIISERLTNLTSMIKATGEESYDSIEDSSLKLGKHLEDFSVIFTSCEPFLSYDMRLSALIFGRLSEISEYIIGMVLQQAVEENFFLHEHKPHWLSKFCDLMTAVLDFALSTKSNDSIKNEKVQCLETSVDTALELIFNIYQSFSSVHVQNLAFSEYFQWAVNSLPFYISLDETKKLESAELLQTLIVQLAVKCFISHETSNANEFINQFANAAVSCLSNVFELCQKTAVFAQLKVFTLTLSVILIVFSTLSCDLELFESNERLFIKFNSDVSATNESTQTKNGPKPRQIDVAKLLEYELTAYTRHWATLKRLLKLFPVSKSNLFSADINSAMSRIEYELRAQITGASAQQTYVCFTDLFVTYQKLIKAIVYQVTSY